MNGWDMDEDLENLDRDALVAETNASVPGGCLRKMTRPGMVTTISLPISGVLVPENVSLDRARRQDSSTREWICR